MQQPLDVRINYARRAVSALDDAQALLDGLEGTEALRDRITEALRDAEAVVDGLAEEAARARRALEVAVR